MTVPQSASTMFTSYLADEIKVLLIPPDCSNFSTSCNYVDRNLLLNWDAIQEVVGKVENPTFSYEFCLNFVGKLQPIWNEIEKCGRTITTLQNLEWIACEEEVILDYIMKDDCATKYLENILFLTSIIEHALGDIYSTITTNSPPHLLRDLIATPELNQVFGDLQVFFLQILIGHPNGVNLRNIVWHGFPSVQEIAPLYYYTLLSIISSFGLIVKNKNLEIVHRGFAYESILLFDKIKLKDVFNKQHFKTYLQTPQYIAPCHSVIWEQIMEYHDKHNFRSGILLLLPQIEMTMRLLYSDLNGIDIRARIDQYYFILDTILEEYIDSPKTNKNNIHSKLDSSVLKLIYDIFQSQTGPRLRDKISHGDLLTSKLNFEIFEKLLTLVYHLIQIHNIDDYEIVYHPNRVLVEKIKQLLQLSLDINTLNIPNELFIDNKVLNLISIDFNDNNVPNLKIFYRLKIENEIISLLIKIIDNFNTALNNLIYNLKTRIELFSKFQLHSKRRETLKNFISNLDVVLNEGIYKITNLIITFFGKIQNHNCLADMDEKQISIVVKFLKKLLKFSENVAKYLQVDHNRWLESFKLTQDINKLLSSKKHVLIHFE